MNLTQLRYVKAVASHGSFTQAAEECFVTQPTLSNGIAQLEQEFEQRLFIRTTRAVSLTPFGESILPFIDKVLAAEKDLTQAVRTFVRPNQQFIRIGISPLISAAWLGPVLEAFRRENSGLEIMLHEQNMADLYRMLDEGLLDFVFGVVGVNKGKWESIPLYEEPLFYIPKGGVGQSGKGQKVIIDDLADETFVMVPNACGLAQTTRSLFRSRRKKLKEYSGEALSYQVLEEWARLGLGAAILPKSKLAASGKKSFQLIGKDKEPILINFEAVWPNSEIRPNMVQKFINHILSRNQAGYILSGND